MNQAFRSGRHQKNSNHNRTRQLIVMAAAATALLVKSGTATAAATYTGGGSVSSPTSGDWNTAGHWSSNSVPTGSNTTELDFLGATSSYTATDDISGAFVLNLLKLDASNSVIAANSGDSLSFAGTNPSIEQTGSGTFTISAPINLSASTAIQQVSGGVINLTGNVTQSASNTLSLTNTTGSGSSTVSFSGANTYAGLTVNSNVTAVSALTSNTTTLGSGTVTLNGGKLALQGQQSGSNTPVQQTVGITAASFNADTILDNAATSGTQSSTGTPTSTVDSNNLFYEDGYTGNSTHGLPTGGAVTSASTGHAFQLATDSNGHYTINNTLQFTSVSDQSVTLTTPAKFQTLDFLTTGQGSPSFTVVLHFSNSTTATLGSFTTSDWYGGNGPTNAVTGLNPVQQANGVVQNYAGALTIQENDLAVPLADQSLTVTSIEFDATSVPWHSADVYAISGQEFGTTTTLSSQTYANAVSVTANSTIDVSVSLAAVMGNLSIAGNKLSVTSADTSGSAYSLTLGTATLGGNPTFDVASSTGGGAGTLNLGALADGGTARNITINPTGSGTVTLASAASSLVAGTVVNVDGGTLNSNNATALGTTATVNLASPGIFNVGASQQISALTGSSGSVALNSNTLMIGSTDSLNSTFGGVISGAGAISIGNTGVGGGAVTLGGASTYSGNTYIKDGTLVLAGSTTTTAGAITNGPAGAGTIYVGAGSGAIATELVTDTTPGRTIANNISVTSGNTADGQIIGGLNASGIATYSGIVTLGTGSTGDYGHNLTLAATNGGEVDFTGNILANLGVAHSQVTVENLSGTGSATVKVFGNNTYAGGTVISPNVTYAAGLSTSTTQLGSGLVQLSGGTLALQGQQMHGSQQTISVSGFNQSLIVPASATSAASATTSTIDGSNVLYQNGFAPTGSGTYALGLNASGLYTSQYNPNVQFQLAPYTGSTALQLNNTGPNTGTLTLGTPNSFSNIDILSTGHGPSIMTVTFNFAGGTTESQTLTAQDWYYNGSQSRLAIGGNGAGNIGSANRSPDAENDFPAGLYENDFTLSPTDESKTLNSITFTDNFTGAGISADIFAVSGSSYVPPSTIATQTYNLSGSVNGNPGYALSVTANSSIDVSGSLAAVINSGLTSMGSNTLSITSADKSGSAYSLTLGGVEFQGTTPTFNVANSAGGGTGTLVLGSLDDNPQGNPTGNAQTITKSGAGTLILSADALSLVNGTIINITAGTLDSNSANATGGFAAINISSGATFGIGASQVIGSLADNGSVPVNGSSVALNGNTLTVGTITDQSSTYSGRIVDGTGATGTGGLYKGGNGTLTLVGANTYSGGTTVSFGTLLAMNTTGSATGSGPVTVLPQSQALLGGTGAISGAVTVTGNGNIFAGTENNTPGEVAGVLHIGSGSSLGGNTLLDVTAVNTSDEIVIGGGTGSVTLGGVLTVKAPNSTSFAAGQDYTLLDFGSVSGTFGTLNLPTLPSGLGWDTSHLYNSGPSGGYIDVTVAAPPSLLWDNSPAGATGDGKTWDSGADAPAQNWNNGGAASFFTSGQAVTFNDSNNGNYNVNLTSNVLPGSITVNSAKTYAIGSTAGWNIGDYGSPTTLAQSGGGTLVIDDMMNTFTGATSVTGAGTTLILHSNSALASSQLTVGAGAAAQISGLLTNTPAVIADGNITVGASDSHNNPANGKLALTWNSLTIGSGATVTLSPTAAAKNVTVLTVASLSDSGTLDIGNNEMFITYGASDPITTIAAYIKSGYNGNRWNGTGIISSAAQSKTNGLLYGVGYADGKDKVVAGLTSGEIEVAYTLLGDANLDGLVNGSDFNILAANFNQSITGWDQGDFNYDGLVNASDFNELAANFNQGVSIGSASGGDFAALDAFAVANGLSLPTSSVPEPASMGLLAMGAIGILARRRRRPT
jgi:autotransporter-associated beta strand protein